MANSKLLTRTLDYIIDNQPRWDQTTFRSAGQPAKCCFGSQAVLQSGGQWINEWYDSNDPSLFYLVRMPDGREDYVWVFARELLDLEYVDHIRIIHATNNLDRLIELVYSHVDVESEIPQSQTELVDA